LGTIIQRVWQHHLTANNDYTEVAGLPQGVAPHLYSRELILAAAEFDLPGFPSELQKTIQTMLTTQQTVGELPISLKAEPFNASAEYQAAPGQLPVTIDLAEPKVMAAVSSVLSDPSTSHSSGMLDKLILYKKRLLEENWRCYNAYQNNVANSASTVSTRRTTERKRILFISHSSAYSGAEDSFCKMISAMDSRRYEKYALVALEGLFTRRLREAGATVVCPNAGFGAASVSNAFFLMNTYREIQPHIVHQNDIPGPITAVCAALMNIPMVQHVRIVNIIPFRDASITGHWRKQAAETRHFRGLFHFSVKLSES
jgi:hypothetical protein